MFRKLMCLVLSALLLCGTCALASDASALSQNLLSDWFDYLYLCENMYGDLLWTLDAVDAYLAEPSWDRLQIARTALNTAEDYIALRDLPEALMTEDGYAALMQQGKDVSFVRPETASWQQSRAVALNTCTHLRYDLYSGVFWMPEAQRMQASAALTRRNCQYQLEYLGLSTGYLLLTVDDVPLRDSFREFIAANCPLIDAEIPEDAPDASALMAQANEVLNAIEALKTDMSRLSGQAQANLDLMRDAAETGDLDILTDNAAAIDGLPLMIPEPDWLSLDSAAFMYYWNEADGSMRHAAEREHITAAPHGYAVECPGVTEAGFLTYVSALAELGIECFSSDDTAGHTLYYSLGGSTFALVWSDAGAQIFCLEGPLCLAPLWYIAEAYTGA